MTPAERQQAASDRPSAWAWQRLLRQVANDVARTRHAFGYPMPSPANGDAAPSDHAAIPDGEFGGDDRDPRILLVTRHVPRPPGAGGPPRPWNLLRFLGTRYDLRLATFAASPEDLQIARGLQTICRHVFVLPEAPLTGAARAAIGLAAGEPLSVSWYRDARMAAFIAEQRRHGLAAEIIQGATLARYARGAQAPLILDLAGERDPFAVGPFANGRFPFDQLAAREARLMAHEAASAIERSARTFASAPEEARALCRMPAVDSRKIDWFRDGVDASFWRADGSFPRCVPGFDVVLGTSPRDSAFTTALRCFLDEVWPRLRDRHPRLTFGVLEQEGTAAWRRWREIPGVTVIPRTPDLRPYFAAARMAVAPEPTGPASTARLLEAMAMGLPVVAAPAAAAATGATPDVHLLTAQGPEGFASAMRGLLAAPDRARSIGLSATRFVRENARWEDALSRLAAVLPAGRDLRA